MLLKQPTSHERILCLRCLRSQKTCYCKRVRPFHSRFQFVLLQHPREYRNSIGTARMVHHCIKNSQLIVGMEFSENREVNQLISDPNNHCVVLYPSENSTNISLQSPDESESTFPKGKNHIIFVMDGTWSCAKKMLNRSQNLSQLPQICFTPQKQSEYRIRQQPNANCLSTLEAVHRILELLDPSVHRLHLLEVFRFMVEQQIHHFQINQKPSSLQSSPLPTGRPSRTNRI